MTDSDAADTGENSTFLVDLRKLSEFVLDVRVRWVVVLLSAILSLIAWMLQQHPDYFSPPISLGYFPTMIAVLLLLASNSICHARNPWVRLGQVFLVGVFDTVIVAIGVLIVAMSITGFNQNQSWEIILMMLPIVFFSFPLLFAYSKKQKVARPQREESKLAEIG